MTIMEIGTVQSIVEDFFNTVDELGDELQEWHDNMPENLQNGSKGEEVLEVAQRLQDISGNVMSAPGVVSELEVSYLPYVPKNSKKPSRSDRMQVALRPLDRALDEVRAWLSEREDEDEEAVDEVAQFLDDMTSVFEEAESVDFPRMT